MSIDTRTINNGELYVALRGENHDGHKFLPEAQSRGAVGALIERRGVERLPKALPGVVVADSHQALIDLAVAHRKRLTARTVGITGSVGKTTVKELTRHLLESSGASVQVSAGNFNNLYGLPLSLLRMDADVCYGVFELGISTPGEMKRLAPILQPRVGVITNISATHTEALGSIDGVRSEKLTLLENLSSPGIAVVDGSVHKLFKAAKALCRKVITFAVASADTSGSCGVDVTAGDVTVESTTGYVAFSFEGQRVQLPLFGVEQVTNALCAFATCQALGVEVDMRSLEMFSSEVMAWRGGREEISGTAVIVDCYNANPTSMRAGLKTFAALAPGKQGGRKIAVLGDMLELGASETQEHLAIGNYLASLLRDGGAIDMVITVGERAQLIAEALKKDMNTVGALVIHTVTDSHAAGELLTGITKAGDTVFLKASRGVALESVLEALRAGRRE